MKGIPVVRVRGSAHVKDSDVAGLVGGEHVVPEEGHSVDSVDARSVCNSLEDLRPEGIADVDREEVPGAQQQDVSHRQ